MRVLFWYCDRFEWTPSIKTIDTAPDAGPDGVRDAVVVFVHVEPKDVTDGASETKLVKNAKWLARKWEGNRILLHSFTHLGEEKADPDAALALLRRVQDRLTSAGYAVGQTPYGYFLNLSMEAPGHPLARIYKEF